jgi:o-succinylbenzoate synthase
LAIRFEFRPYARPFKTPLQTHHGEWATRWGLILRLESEAGVGWGEIAPIPTFGSETFAEAQRFCEAMPSQLTASEIAQIPAALPACQFGFEAAWDGATSRSEQPPLKLRSSLLLPTGRAALESPLLFDRSTEPVGPTFKWKIGVAPIEQELALLEELIGLLPTGAKLRLDANGGLTWQQASLWLQICDGYGIEFLEQPLPPDQFAAMQTLSRRYQTPIALDESVSQIPQLQACYDQGWRGIFVIKAPIAGSPRQLRQFCQQGLDLVWSSVFETSIARRYIEQLAGQLADQLAATLPPTERAHGFGVDHWFSDGWERLAPEQIWQRL